MIKTAMHWDETMEESQVAAQAAAQPVLDRAQFTAFYERSSRSLWAYLFRCSGDAALAEDLMQEAYMRFLNAARSTDHDETARKYLFRIGSNLLHDHWRRPKTLQLEEVPESRFAIEAGEYEMVVQQQLAKAMGQMKARDRQLLWLAHAENYSHREIAAIMGLANVSVRILLFRARARMRQLMEGAR